MPPEEIQDVTNDTGAEPGEGAINAFDAGDFFESLESGGQKPSAEQTAPVVPDGYIPKTELEGIQSSNTELSEKIKMMEWQNAELQQKLSQMSTIPQPQVPQTPQVPQMPQVPKQLEDMVPGELRPYLQNENDKKLIETMLTLGDHRNSPIMDQLKSLNEKIENFETQREMETLRAENTQNFNSAMGRIVNSLGVGENESAKSFIDKQIQSDPDIVRLAESPEWQSLPSEYRWMQMENIMKTSAMKAMDTINSIQEAARQEERNKIAGINTGSPDGASVPAGTATSVPNPADELFKKEMRGEISMEQLMEELQKLGT